MHSILHPDKVQDEEKARYAETARSISTAYNILKNPLNSRAEYDKLGSGRIMPTTPGYTAKQYATPMNFGSTAKWQPGWYQTTFTRAAARADTALFFPGYGLVEYLNRPPTEWATPEHTRQYPL